jgi:hypothetical protein
MFEASFRVIIGVIETFTRISGKNFNVRIPKVIAAFQRISQIRDD